MCADHRKEQESYGYHNLTTVAWAILIMGVSLAAVIILWVLIGHIGPSFSADTLVQQQKTLREKYGLPAEQIAEDPQVLLTPPSLRKNETQTSGGGGGGAGTSTATTSSSTAGGGNATNATAGGGGGAATTAGEGGGVSLSILQGASTQGNPAYSPNPLTVKKGDSISVVNKDAVPHTVTNGKDPSDPNSAKLFDTSIINAGQSAQITTTKLSAGQQYPFHCTVHPYMTGTLKVS
jgi:plastocyanin